MDTRKYFVIAAVLIFLIILLSFIPVNNKREVIIKARLYDVAKQINDLNNWKKWNPDLSNKNITFSGGYYSDQSATISAKQSYSLHHINPLAVSFTRKINNVSKPSLLAISSLSNDSLTYVVWSEDITIFELIKRNLTKINSRQTSLDNLKKLMENINYKYGFYINIVPVKDTLLLTSEELISNKNSANVVADLYESLQSFIKKNNLPSETKYFYKTILSNSKIAVGIPVYKRAANYQNIKFLQLPSNGRLVEGDYSGTYYNKQKIYAAINNFMLDQHLKQVAQPLEQYIVADSNINANSNINIKIFYPVF